MDVAIDLNLNNAPLSVVYETAPHTQSFTKHIIKIGLDDVSVEDSSPEKVCFINSPLDKTISDLEGDILCDAVLLNTSSHLPAFDTIKDIALSKAIPLILYTPTFDESAR